MQPSIPPLPSSSSCPLPVPIRAPALLAAVHCHDAESEPASAGDWCRAEAVQGVKRRVQGGRRQQQDLPAWPSRAASLPGAVVCMRVGAPAPLGAAVLRALELEAVRREARRAWLAWRPRREWPQLGGAPHVGAPHLALQVVPQQAGHGLHRGGWGRAGRQAREGRGLRVRGWPSRAAAQPLAGWEQRQLAPAGAWAARVQQSGGTHELGCSTAPWRAGCGTGRAAGAAGRPRAPAASRPPAPARAVATAGEGKVGGSAGHGGPPTSPLVEHAPAAACRRCRQRATLAATGLQQLALVAQPGGGAVLLVHQQARGAALQPEQQRAAVQEGGQRGCGRQWDRRGQSGGRGRWAKSGCPAAKQECSCCYGEQVTGSSHTQPPGQPTRTLGGLPQLCWHLHLLQQVVQRQRARRPQARQALKLQAHYGVPQGCAAAISRRQRRLAAWGP